MSDQDNQSSKEAQKTIISFIAGLIIGGLLVWVFGGTNGDTPTDELSDSTIEEIDTSDDTEDAGTDEEDSTAPTSTEDADNGFTSAESGSGSIDVSDQPAGSSVTLEGAVFPSDEGWIGVRDYVNGQLGSILGVSRFSREQGRLPNTINLQRATEAGREYAIVFYRESGDRKFNLAQDELIEDIIETFTAE